MLRVINIIIILLLAFSLSAEEQFGYINYSTLNIGDDFQAIAAKRFLPNDAIGIDREFIGVFDFPKTVRTIVNGWFMHTKDLYWYRADVPGPEKSWPPAPCIDPLLISIHFWDGFLPTILSDESLAYLRLHAPIGARDLSTMEFLQAHGIPSYFSGCLTLTLVNPYSDSDRRNIIYAVDIDDSCYRYLKKNATCKVIRVTHIFQFPPNTTEEERMRVANKLLERYRKAKCVITQRFHASMPCLAFNTPVLFLGPTDSRFKGNIELLHTCSKEDFVNGRANYDFNNPPKNKPDYLPLRENLIKTVTEWVNEHSLSGVN